MSKNINTNYQLDLNVEIGHLTITFSQEYLFQKIVNGSFGSTAAY